MHPHHRQSPRLALPAPAPGPVHRPALIRCAARFTLDPTPPLVPEDVDRLSRNAVWQQGFLLEALARRA